MAFFSSFKNSLIDPTKLFVDISKEEASPIRSIAMLLLSNGVLIFVIMLGQILFASDLIYTTFDYQTNSFIIEIYTSMKFLGYYIPSNLLPLIFLEKLIFMMKMWIIPMLFVYILIYFSKEEVDFMKVFEVFSWTSSVLLILAGITAVFLGIRFIQPLYYHYIYYLIFVAFFVLVIPIYLIVGLGKISGLSLYKRTLLILSLIPVFFILWTYNHSFIILAPAL